MTVSSSVEDSPGGFVAHVPPLLQSKQQKFQSLLSEKVHGDLERTALIQASDTYPAREMQALPTHLDFDPFCFLSATILRKGTTDRSATQTLNKHLRKGKC
jgi:hypothetical protein